MAGQTGIEWTDATWNPIVGCSIVSPGCTNCYAMKMAARIEAALASPKYICGGARQYLGTTKKVNGNAVWTGKVAMAPDDTITEPLRWKKPRRIFVNSMGDLFHESIPDEWIDKVFAVMALCPQHTFQVLTKRAERMRAYCARLHDRDVEIAQRAVWLGIWDDPEVAAADTISALDLGFLPNVWLGVSTERQKEADERIPHLLATPAAVRFISAEPLIGPIDLDRLKYLNVGQFSALKYWGPEDWRGLDWVIVGGESGPHARPMHPDWARSLRDQCKAAGVPFFFKQWGEFHPISFNDLASEEIESEELAGRLGGFDDQPMHRVGKKAAGRLLDGKEHNAFPDTSAKARAA